MDTPSAALAPGLPPAAEKVFSVASLAANEALPPSNEGLACWKDEKLAAERSRCSTISCARCRRTYTSMAPAAAKLASVMLSDTPAGKQVEECEGVTAGSAWLAQPQPPLRSRQEGGGRVAGGQAPATWPPLLFTRRLTHPAPRPLQCPRSAP